MENEPEFPFALFYGSMLAAILIIVFAIPPLGWLFVMWARYWGFS